MKINVYLPDDLHARAKTAEVPFSQTFRAAIQAEVQRREAMSQTTADPQVYEVELVSNEDLPYRGRITGTRLWGDERDGGLYLTTDQRVIAYYDREYWTLGTEGKLMDDLRAWISDPGELTGVCRQLGIKAVIDL